MSMSHASSPSPLTTGSPWPWRMRHQAMHAGDLEVRGRARGTGGLRGSALRRSGIDPSMPPGGPTSVGPGQARVILQRGRLTPHPPGAPVRPDDSMFMAMRFAVLRDLFRMLGASKRWWLAPLLIVLVVLGLALAGLQAVSYLSPFIYAVL